MKKTEPIKKLMLSVSLFNLTLILIQNLSNLMKKTEPIKKLMLSVSLFNLTLILIQNLSNLMKKTEPIKKLIFMAKWFAEISLAKTWPCPRLLRRVKHLLPSEARITSYNSLIVQFLTMPISFEETRIILLLWKICKYCKIKPQKLSSICRATLHPLMLQKLLAGQHYSNSALYIDTLPPLSTFTGL